MGKVARYLPNFRAGRIFPWTLGVVCPMLSAYHVPSEQTFLQFKKNKMATVVHTEVSRKAG